jgi:hypothetical protein
MRCRVHRDAELRLSVLGVPFCAVCQRAAHRDAIRRARARAERLARLPEDGSYGR